MAIEMLLNRCTKVQTSILTCLRGRGQSSCGSRRRYDPAACRLPPAQLRSSKSVNCEAGAELGRKSSESCSPVCCCCKNQDILPAPRRNSRDFFAVVLPPPPKAISALVALSPPGSVWLPLLEYFPKCVSAAGKTGFDHCDEYFYSLEHISPSHRVPSVKGNTLDSMSGLRWAFIS